MQEKRASVFTALALATAAGVSVADLMLPPQIETIFFYTIPVLLCARSGCVRLPYFVTAIAVIWTAAITTIEVTATPQPTDAILYEALRKTPGITAPLEGPIPQGPCRYEAD